jgi:uncharacterized protein (DUF2141 family)
MSERSGRSPVAGRPGIAHGAASRRAGVFSCALALFAAACASEAPPPGGPEDKVGPTVISSTPTADSTNVDPGSGIVVTFSEDMSRARVERLLVVQPSIVIGRVRWEGRTMTVLPQEPLQRDTTYVVRVKPGGRDAHGVASTASFEFAFATGAVLDTARIEGAVFLKKEPAGRALVRCFRLPRGPDFDPLAERPDREAASARDGKFSLRYLPANEARYIVAAFMDRNGNGNLDRTSEPFAVFPDTVLLTPHVPVVSGINIAVVDPNEPGIVRGSVVNETGIDTLRVSLNLFTVEDSTRARMHARCDSTGAFELRNVRPGDYVLRAFLDLRADSTCGVYDCPPGAEPPCREPCVRLPGTVSVKVASVTELPPLILRWEEEP